MQHFITLFVVVAVCAALLNALETASHQTVDSLHEELTSSVSVPRNSNERKPEIASIADNNKNIRNILIQGSISITPIPSLAPAITPYPSIEPTASTVPVVTFPTTVTITNYDVDESLLRADGLSSGSISSDHNLRASNNNNERLLTEVILDSNSQLSVVEACALAQNIPTSYVTYGSANQIASFTIDVTTITNVPQTGSYSSLSANEINSQLITSFKTAVNNGDFSNYLQTAASVNGASSLTSASGVSDTITSGNITTATVYDSNDDDQITLSDNDITAIVICSCVGLTLFTVAGMYLYQIYQKSALQSVTGDESSVPLSVENTSTKKEVDVDVRFDETYRQKSEIDAQNSPRGRHSSIRGIDIANISSDGPIPEMYSSTPRAEDVVVDPGFNSPQFEPDSTDTK